MTEAVCTSTLETRWKEERRGRREREREGERKHGRELFEYNRDSCRFVGRPRLARGAERARSSTKRRGGIGTNI